MSRLFLWTEFHRRRRGLTLTALSNRTGLAVPHLSLLENGERVPAHVLEKLAKFFGCPAGILQQPLPDDWSPQARRAALEAEFADVPESEAHRKAQAREAAARDAEVSAREQTGAMTLDEFNARIAAGRK